MDVIIYHNPDCGTSRNTLGLIRNADIEPHIIEYLKCPPTRLLLEQLITRMGIPVRALLREKGTPFGELGLNNERLSDDQLLDAMVAHPVALHRCSSDRSPARAPTTYSSRRPRVALAFAL